MGDEQKIERLREHLKVIEHYETRMYALAAAKAEIGNKIAALEAAAADPWRDAKKSIDHWRSCGMWPDITGLYDHLSAENERLTKRVAKLEAAEHFRIDPDTGTLEVDHVGPEPGPLEPDCVLATAAEVYSEKGMKSIASMCRFDAKDAKPYRLKGAGE